MSYLRGAVWIGVGAAIYAVGLVTGHQLSLPRTNVPWGLVLVGIGLLLVGWDSWRHKGSKSEPK